MVMNSLEKSQFSLSKTEKKLRRGRRKKVFVDRAEKVICDALEKFLSQEGVAFDKVALGVESRQLAQTLAERFSKYSKSDVSGLEIDDESAFFDALLQHVKRKS